MNKKGSVMTNLLFFIMVVPLIIFIYIFVSSLILETAKDSTVETLDNLTLEFYNRGDISENMANHLQEQNEDFNNFDYKPDLFFLFGFLFVFVSTLIIAIKSRSVSNMAFFGHLTFVISFSLMILGIMVQVIQWVKSEIYDRVLINLPYTTPIMDYVLSNIGIVCTLWGFLLILINKLDFSVSNNDLKKEEGFGEI